MGRPGEDTSLTSRDPRAEHDPVTDVAQESQSRAPEAAPGSGRRLAVELTLGQTDTFHQLWLSSSALSPFRNPSSEVPSDWRARLSQTERWEKRVVGTNAVGRGEGGYSFSLSLNLQAGSSVRLHLPFTKPHLS